MKRVGDFKGNGKTFRGNSEIIWSYFHSCQLILADEWKESLDNQYLRMSIFRMGWICVPTAQLWFWQLLALFQSQFSHLETPDSNSAYCYKVFLRFHKKIHGKDLLAQNMAISEHSVLPLIISKLLGIKNKWLFSQIPEFSNAVTGCFRNLALWVFFF